MNVDFTTFLFIMLFQLSRVRTARSVLHLRTMSATSSRMLPQRCFPAERGILITRPFYRGRVFSSMRGGGGGSFVGNDSKEKETQPGPMDDISLNHGPLPVLLGSYPVSACSIRGLRSYMEDEFVAAPDFCAVFDGHGGSKVSKYLRQNLYAELQTTLPQVVGGMRESSKAKNSANSSVIENGAIKNATATVDAYEAALKLALDKVDQQVLKINHWSYQGSAVVAVWLHTSDDNEQTKTVITANIGDSRAVLSRGGEAIDLSVDHKPDHPKEYERIRSLGGSIDWFGSVDAEGNPIEGTGLYRVNGNMALSRAIGDRSERPFVSGEPDITVTPLQKDDEFIVIATDGLWDAFTSQDVVTLVNAIRQSPKHDLDDLPRIITAHALRSGSSDNITILIVWLKPTLEAK